MRILPGVNPRVKIVVLLAALVIFLGVTWIGLRQLLREAAPAVRALVVPPRHPQANHPHSNKSNHHK